MPYLIASDLDGTLFGADSQVSKRTREAISRVTERGHTMVAVTGRSWMTAWNRLEPVIGIDHLMASNGACDYRRGEGVVGANSIAASEAKAWAALIGEQLSDASFGWECEDTIGFDPVFTAAAGELDEAAHAGNADWPDGQDMIKLYVRSPQLTAVDLQRLTRELLGERAEVSTSGAPFVEVTAAGVDKAAALRRVSGKLGFALTNTIAFGDNHNDLPMLTAAGLSVVMANAVPELLETADRQALENTQDGVARVLEDMLDSGEL